MVSGGANRPRGLAVARYLPHVGGCVSLPKRRQSKDFRKATAKVFARVVRGSWLKTRQSKGYRVLTT